MQHLLPPSNALKSACSLLLLLTSVVHGRPQPVGIQNPSLACYMNANMQALLVTPFFTEIALLATKVACASNPFIPELLGFQRAYDAIPDGGVYVPDKFYELLIEQGVKIDVRCTADASEALNSLIDTYNTKAAAHNCFLTLFDWKRTQQTTCTVCHTKTTLTAPEKLLKITKQATSAKATDIELGLTHYTHTETIEKYNCATCKKKTTVEQRIFIAQAPEVLLILAFEQLVTGPQTTETKSLPHTAPLNLDISDWADKTLPRKDLLYTLKAIVCHSSGHYTALVSYPTGWYFCNDSTAVPITGDMQQIITQQGQYLNTYNPVIFFYVRTESKYTGIAALNDLNAQLSTITALQKLS